MPHNNAVFPFETGGVNGEVDFVGQIDALISDGFTEAVSLEAHWCPKRQSRLRVRIHPLLAYVTCLNRLR